MPQGTVQSLSPDHRRGQILPDEGGDPVGFSYDDVDNRQGGEGLREGITVTYEVENEKATRVSRVAEGGYG